jgi:hypothetical protein
LSNEELICKIEKLLKDKFDNQDKDLEKQNKLMKKLMSGRDKLYYRENIKLENRISSLEQKIEENLKLLNEKNFKIDFLFLSLLFLLDIAILIVIIKMMSLY